MAAAADLLTVDTKVVERLSAPAENELQNVVKLFQGKIVRYRNQLGDERAEVQQYDRRVRRSQQDGVGMNLHYPYPTPDL